MRLGDISEDRGTEEITVLVDWEVQHWVAEALEGAKLASSLVGDRIAKIGAQRAGRDGEEGRDEGDGPSPADRKAKQAVLDTARGDPISDSLVRLALAKTTYPEAEGGKAVVACISATEETAGGEAAQAPGAASQFALDHRLKRRLDTEQEAKDLLPRSAKTGNPPRVSSAA
jgi:hypothetical protein